MSQNSLKGFSLVELLLTMSIIGIVLGISTLTFSSWVRKYGIESQVRSIYLDLNQARTNAFTRKKVYGVVFQTNGYTMRSYSSSAEYTPSSAASSNGRVEQASTLKYSITKNGNDISDTPVIFDTHGYTNDLLTLYVEPVSIDASINCISISNARVNMGKINGTNCDFK